MQYTSGLASRSEIMDLIRTSQMDNNQLRLLTMRAYEAYLIPEAQDDISTRHEKLRLLYAEVGDNHFGCFINDEKLE
jgi:hypothetical protein